MSIHDREMDLIVEAIIMIDNAKNNENFGLVYEIVWSALQHLKVTPQQFVDALNYGYGEWIK